MRESATPAAAGGILTTHETDETAHRVDPHHARHRFVMQERSSERGSSRWKAAGLSALFIVGSLTAKLVPWWGLASIGELPRWIVAGTLALAAVVGLTVLFVRRLPGYPQPGLALLPRGTRRGLGLATGGLAAGAALFGVVFGVVVATGGIQVQWIGSGAPQLLAAMATVFVATVLNAAWEELTFRGWPFSACVKAFGPHRVSVGLGAAFGLCHLLNPLWTPAAIVSTAIAGLLICYTMLACRDILAPVGLHVGWNYCQSMLTSRRFWTVTPHPSSWLSGGRYGLEASAAGIGITALAAIGAMVVFVRIEHRG